MLRRSNQPGYLLLLVSAITVSTDVPSIAEEQNGFQSRTFDRGANSGASPEFSHISDLSRRPQSGSPIVRNLQASERRAPNFGGGTSKTDHLTSFSGSLEWMIAPHRSTRVKPGKQRNVLPWLKKPTWWVGYNPAKSVIPVFEAAKSWSNFVEHRLAEKGYYLMPFGFGFRFNLTPDPILDWKQVIGDPAPDIPSKVKGATATSGK